MVKNIKYSKEEWLKILISSSKQYGLNISEYDLDNSYLYIMLGSDFSGGVINIDEKKTVLVPNSKYYVLEIPHKDNYKLINKKYVSLLSEAEVDSPFMLLSYCYYFNSPWPEYYYHGSFKANIENDQYNLLFIKTKPKTYKVHFNQFDSYGTRRESIIRLRNEKYIPINKRYCKTDKGIYPFDYENMFVLSGYLIFDGYYDDLRYVTFNFGKVISYSNSLEELFDEVTNDDIQFGIYKNNQVAYKTKNKDWIFFNYLSYALEKSKYYSK